MRPDQTRVAGLFAALLMLFNVWAFSCSAKSLSVELAADHIDITTGFSGAKVEVFGHRKDMFTEVAITIRGPEKTATIWQKAKFLGAWINRYSVSFKNVPLYYNYALDQGQLSRSASLLDKNGIGVEALFLKNLTDMSSTIANAEIFKEALITDKKKKGLYPTKAQPIKFMNEYFFRAEFNIPPDAPTGEYKITSMLFKDGKLLETDVDLLRVEQVGLNAFVFKAAHKQGLLYGVISVLLALLSGWFVGVLRIRI